MLVNCSYQKLVPTSQLVPHDKNANVHSKKQIEMLAKILKYQGWRHPIVVSGLSGKIVAGHGRLESAKLNGWVEVPVDVQKFDDVAQELAFLLSDNFIAELAETNEEMLIQIGAELGVGFDHELLGLEESIIIPDLDKDAIEDEVPEVTESISKLGDVYELGNHRLVCGDSTLPDVVALLMNGEKAQTFFSDPPYGDDVGGLRTKAAHERVEGKTLIKRTASIIGDTKIDWLVDAFRNAKDSLQESFTAMVFFKWDHYAEIEKMGECFGKPSACCVWDRDRKASAFFRFQPQHEFCFHWGNQADKKTTSSLSNVWRVRKELENNELHPTVKPIDLLHPVIEVTTSVGGSVLDLFGGSGSTLIACEKTKRKCFMMELDSHYCDVIVSRYVKYSGNKEIKRNGEPMNWTLS